jgi:hypothetical protein
MERIIYPRSFPHPIKTFHSQSRFNPHQIQKLGTCYGSIHNNDILVLLTSYKAGALSFSRSLTLSVPGTVGTRCLRYCDGTALLLIETVSRAKGVPCGNRKGNVLDTS